MSELGNIYKKAHQIVLNRYATEKDRQGRSQAWKVAAINEDKKVGKDTGLIKTYVDEVEATVDRLLSEENKLVSAEPISPAKPH